jgi:hypothetical protein
MVVRGRLAERADERRFRVDERRRAHEGGDHRRPGDAGNLCEDRLGILLGQVAHVDVDVASVGHLVEGVATQDPAEVDRRPIEELRAPGGKR